MLEIPEEARELAVRIVNLPAGAREPLRQLLDCEGPQLLPEPLPAELEPVAVPDTVAS